MATVIPFDTLAFVKELETAGVPAAQAEAQAKVLAVTFQKVEDARQADLATKGDILRLERDIKELELRMAAEIAPLKWGMAVAVGGIVALLLKGFMPH